MVSMLGREFEKKRGLLLDDAAFIAEVGAGWGVPAWRPAARGTAPPTTFTPRRCVDTCCRPVALPACSGNAAPAHPYALPCPTLFEQVRSGQADAPGMDPEIELQRLVARYKAWKREFKVRGWHAMRRTHRFGGTGTSTF